MTPDLSSTRIRQRLFKIGLTLIVDRASEGQPIHYTIFCPASGQRLYTHKYLENLKAKTDELVAEHEARVAAMGCMS